jgi:hypothetical protein
VLGRHAAQEFRPRFGLRRLAPTGWQQQHQASDSTHGGFHLNLLRTANLVIGSVALAAYQRSRDPEAAGTRSDASNVLERWQAEFAGFAWLILSRI